MTEKIHHFPVRSKLPCAYAVYEAMRRVQEIEPALRDDPAYNRLIEQKRREITGGAA
jgi:hypothetical protein